MKDTAFNNYIKSVAPFIIALVLFGMIFKYIIIKSAGREITYEDEVTCYVTRDNSGNFIHGAFTICDSLNIPSSLLFLSSRSNDSVLKRLNINNMQNVPFPYELSKKRGSDTIVVVTEKQDTLLFYLPKFKPYENGIKTLFTDPKRYFREFFKIKEE